MAPLGLQHTFTQQTRVRVCTILVGGLLWHVEVNWVHCSVVRWRKMLHEIVREVFSAWFPDDSKLPLASAVL